MATKLFIDTNIFLDLFDNKRPNHLESQELFKKIEQEEVLAYTSESVITTMDYILGKLLPRETTKEIFSEIIRNVSILPCTNLIVAKALHSKLEDLEDAILHEISIENNLDYFITHDAEVLRKSITGPIMAVTALDFLSAKS